MLANLYINRFLKHWRLTGRERAFRAAVVSYADDFIILSRGRADEALAWTCGVMAKLGLTINEAKTSVKNARVERFDFLGYSFGPHWSPKQKRWKNGRVYQCASPSKKSIGRLKDKVSDILVAVNPSTWDDVGDRLNAILRGWSSYFAYGGLTNTHRAVNHHVTGRVRVFLTRRHKVRGHGYKVFPDRRIYWELGVLRLSRNSKSKTAVSLP